ncbi:putative inner membrane lipoprotein [Trichinella spiralis]|uniref:putative inner membrane lipoprotein n=1 Tax=Trichinella spiralis TaxID=6334 RepID=UPI0001EFBFC5|nr:putative inner membrane lipoprotein [Trichinella spiralis]
MTDNMKENNTREFTPPNGKEPSPLVGTKPLFFRNCFRSCSSPAELSRLCSARSSVAAAFSVLVVLVPLGAASAADAVSTRSLAVDVSLISVHPAARWHFKQLKDSTDANCTFRYRQQANVNNNSDNKLLLTVVLVR